MQTKQDMGLSRCEFYNKLLKRCFNQSKRDFWINKDIL